MAELDIVDKQHYSFTYDVQCTVYTVHCTLYKLIAFLLFPADFELIHSYFFSKKSFADFKINLGSRFWCYLSKVYCLLCVLLQGQGLEEGEQVEHRSSLKVLDQGGDQIVHLNKSINY